MKISKIKLLVLFLLFMFPLSTFSSSCYTNDLGVQVTKKEFDFINEFYGEEYFSKMTLEDYMWIKDLDLNNSEIEIKKVSDLPTISLYSISSKDTEKTLTIAKSCNTVCNIIINVIWLKIPTIKSYDVIGARFKNTNIVNSDNISTRIKTSNSTNYTSSSNNKKFNFGFGTSVKLPSTATSISIEQKFSVSKNGTVFASYQHSKKNISLEISKLYSISSSGYGSVFSFYGNALNTFDNMSGVSINV